MDAPIRRRSFLGATAALGAVALTGCQPGQNPSRFSGGNSSQAAVGNRTFSLALSSPVGGLDPLLATTAEQFLVCRQIFQRLVGVDPDTGVPTPTQLATEWHIEDDGLSYIFRLAQEVRFHDGSVCNASAVLANVQRWARAAETFPAVAAGIIPDYFGYVFGTTTEDTAPRNAPSKKKSPASDKTTPAEAGKKAPDGNNSADVVPGRGNLIFASADDEYTVRLRLTKPLPALLPALAHTAFSICSPTALERFQAAKLSQAHPQLPKSGQVSLFALTPVGTGPYKIGKARRRGQTVLEQTGTKYAGPQRVNTVGESSPTRVELSSYRTGAGRLRVLEQGLASGCTDITGEEVRPVLQQGFRFLQRDPFAMTYLGINHKHPQLKSLKIRQLIACALDTAGLSTNYFLEGTFATRQFTPAALAVPKDSFPEPAFDRAAVAEEVAKLKPGPIKLYFPTDTSRPWLPLPERTALAIARQLTEAGFTIRPVPVPWDDGYLQKVQENPSLGLYLWGSVGSYRDPLAFLAPIVQGGGPSRNYRSSRAVSLLEEMRHAPMQDKRRLEAAAALTNHLANDVATIPLCCPISALALARSVQYYPTSPVLDELFARIRLNVG